MNSIVNVGFQYYSPVLITVKEASVIEPALLWNGTVYLWI